MNNIWAFRLITCFMLCIVIIFFLLGNLTAASTLTFVLLGFLSFVLILVSFLPPPFNRYSWNLREGHVKKFVEYATVKFAVRKIIYSNQCILVKHRYSRHNVLAFDELRNEHIVLLSFETEYESLAVQQVLEKDFGRSLQNMNLPKGLQSLYRSRFSVGPFAFVPGEITFKNSDDIPKILLSLLLFFVLVGLGYYYLTPLILIVFSFVNKYSYRTIIWDYKNRVISRHTFILGIRAKSKTKKYSEGMSVHLKYEYDSYDEPYKIYLYVNTTQHALKKALGIKIAYFRNNETIRELEQIIQANMPDFKIMDWHE